jgi:hypothetical protein
MEYSTGVYTPIEPGISLKIVAQVGLSALVPWDELHCHASQAQIISENCLS